MISSVHFTISNIFVAKMKGSRWLNFVWEILDIFVFVNSGTIISLNLHMKSH